MAQSTYTPGPGYYGVTRDPNYLHYYNSSFPELYQEPNPGLYASRLKGPVIKQPIKSPQSAKAGEVSASHSGPRSRRLFQAERRRATPAAGSGRAEKQGPQPVLKAAAGEGRQVFVDGVDPGPAERVRLRETRRRRDNT